MEKKVLWHLFLVSMLHNLIFPPFSPWVCTIKHCGSVFYGLYSKLVSLFVQASVYLFVQAKKQPSYYKICPFTINYKSIKVYSTGPGASHCWIRTLRTIVYCSTNCTGKLFITKTLWQNELTFLLGRISSMFANGIGAERREHLTAAYLQGNLLA
jgi:hypothetical protein